MVKRTYLTIQLLIAVYFLAYLNATIHISTLWGDILSPIGGLIAGIILLIATLRTDQPRLCWLFSTLACFSYATADILWAYYELGLGINPENLDIVMGLYLLPKFFIALSVCSFLLTKKNSWNRYQISLDILAISAVLLTIIWIVFFQQHFNMLINLNIHTLSVYLYLILDFFAFGCMIVWYAFLSRQKIPIIGILNFSAITLYVITDFYYSYLAFYTLYIPNSVIDAFYVLSLLIFAQAGLWEIYRPMETAEISEIIDPDLSDVQRKGFIILIPPLLLFFFKGFYLEQFLIFAGIYIVHQVLSNYVQSFIYNEHLLAQEQKMNSVLEDRIADRTRELIIINNELDILSKQDPITRLYNRRYFMQHFYEMLNNTLSTESVYLFFMDLDRFKAINDSYGHDIGDKVLIEIARRLNECNHYNALLARLGGDEFVYAMRGQYNNNEIEGFAQDIIQFCNDPVIISPFSFHITLSIGITHYPEDARERRELMKNADIAMYHSKSLGFNRYTFFSTLGPKIQRRNTIEMLLKKADFDQEFELYFQPQIKIPQNKLIGMEALLRWHNPEQGSIFPDEFIPIAEEVGIIVSLGRWIIEKSIIQIAEWNRTYQTQLKMGINISPRQLESFDLITHLKNMITKYDISPEWLDIEITESIAMKGESAMEEIFSIISELGVSISIDDFGTGYSSLSYLKHYSFDRLKIAKPLIDHITTDFSDIQIVKAIIMIGKSLGIHTIAEGVEFPDQLNLLTELGCDEVQGYLFSRPIPAADFEKIFLKGKSSSTCA